MRSFFSRAALPSLISVLAVAGLLVLVLRVGAGADQARRFPRAVNTQDPDDVLPAAQEVVEKISVPAGFHATLFAAEPDVKQPIALTTDDRGRIWVAENYTYAEREVNFATDLRDRIIILEDTDQDGRFDRRTVFWDRGQKLTSVELGFGGVWALCAPRLLFIPDRDRDDVPDGEPQVMLDGWNDGAVRHNIVNGLRWGPDGWLYGRHGIQATSLVGKPGATASQRVRLNCSIWRYHPTRHVFEVVTHGTTNSWGFDYDDHGQMFFTNTVIGHLWHVIPGAHYRRMYGADFNPHVYQLIDQCADHYHWDTGEGWSDIRKGVSENTSRAGGGHAHCGLMIYLGDNWPERYRSTLFTVNLHGLRINNDRVVRRGAGYVGKHREDFLTVNDRWFRGIELIYGPDGGVFIADWTDVGECHENDGVHRTSGRIYKVTHGQPRPPRAFDLAASSDLELVELQLHKNDWYVRHARRLLQERAAVGRDLAAPRSTLLEMFDEQTDVTRKLRALWCLYVMGGLSESWLLEQLDQPDEHIRVWAIRLLSDDGEVGAEVARRFARLARDDASGLVRLFLASAMQRVSLDGRWPIAEALVSRSEDATDPALGLMVWYGIEPAVPVAPERAVALAERSRIPLVRRHIARRLTVDIEKNPAAVSRLVRLLARRQEPGPRLDILQGMNEALRGWRKASTPEGWHRAAAALAESSQEVVRRTAMELSAVFGDGRALDELRRIASTDSSDPEARRQALRVLIENRADGLLPLLRKLVSDRVLSTEAVRGLAAYSHPDTPKLILGHYARLDPDGQEEAITTLTSRPDYARKLLEAVGRGSIDRQAISAYHARQIRSFKDEAINRELSRIWGAVRKTSAEKQEQITELEKGLTVEGLREADLSKGRVVFEKICGNCHVLYGHGGNIGPDLTGSNRHNLDYLLENIVDPSATLVSDFKMSVIIAKDGRVITGVVVEETDHVVTVQTQNERMALHRAEIMKTVPQESSLMPDGLLNPLSAEEIRDLIAYLSGRAQVPLPDKQPAATTTQRQ